MNELTMERLAQRLECLERAVRRWRLVSIGLLLLSGAILLYSCDITTSGKVRAKEFALVVDGGREIATLWAAAGLPTLTFYDSQRRPRLQADLLPNYSPRIYFADSDQRITLRLGAGSEGRGKIEVIDKSGEVIWSTPR